MPATPIIPMGPGSAFDSVTVPSWMISLEDCSVIRAFIPDSVNVSITKPKPFDGAADDVVVWTEDFDGGFNGWTSVSLICGGRKRSCQCDMGMER